MVSSKKDFIENMRERSLVAQVTHEEELRDHLKEEVLTAYCGFDPTAQSFHVGHLLPIMTLARWQKSGHRAIALMGSGTAMVGDPTGKTAMRQMLDDQAISQNVARFRQQLAGLLDFSSAQRGIILDNRDWLLDLRYLEFLREIGSQFSVNRMLTAECFKSRLETGLSFLEFNYMLLQSYDFLHLYRTQKCSVQLGGDDQWSNMLAGVELVRRLEHGRAYCVTVPLLTTSDGRKMGKTEGGAVWLDPTLTRPFDFFQFWRNQTDDMVGPCLRYFTFVEESDIKELEKFRDHRINEAKTILAFEVTKIVHGEEEATKARDAAAQLFAGVSGKGDSGDIAAPEIILDPAALSTGTKVSFVELVVASEIAPSRGEARRLIEQGGLMADGEKVPDSKAEIEVERLKSPQGVLLKKGKKHYYRLRIPAKS